MPKSATGSGEVRVAGPLAPLAGCYLYPMGRRTPLTEELLKYDVDVSWWVAPDAYEHGYYTKLYAALQGWIERSFPFTKAFYSNTELPDLPG